MGIVLFFLIVVGIALSPAAADEVRLKGGHVVEGRVSKTDSTVEVKTLHGTISFPADQVEQITPKRCAVDEYDDLLKGLNRDSVESLLNFAGWCTLHKMRKDCRETFQRVIELDPENEIARSQLGFKKVDGKWVTDADLLKERGLVQYKGRIVVEEELAAVREAERFEEERKKIAVEIRGLLKAIESKEGAERERAEISARSYAPEDRLPMLQEAAESKNDHLRLYAARELGVQSHPGSAGILAKLAVRENEEIRKAALDSLQRIGATPAIETFKQALTGKYYWRRHRAIEAARVLKMEQLIPTLVEILDRTGKVLDDVIPAGAIPVDIRELFVILPDGEVEVVPHVETGMPKFDKREIEARAGVELKKTHEALKELTNADFGRDIGAWKAWIQNHPRLGGRPRK